MATAKKEKEAIYFGLSISMTEIWTIEQCVLGTNAGKQLS